MKKNVSCKKMIAAMSAAILGISLIPIHAMAAKSSPDFQLEIAKLPAEDYSGGKIPGSFDQSYYNYPKHMVQPYVSLPEKYDLRDEGRVTPVKDQSPYGSCWTFGAMSAIESYMGNSDDLSELHLEHFVYSLYQGEGMNLLQVENGLDLGGNADMTNSLLSSWGGVVPEEAAPYEAPWTVDAALRNESVGHLQNADYLPGPAVFDDEVNKTGYHLDTAAMNNIKQMMMQYGVIDMSYNAEQNLPGQPEGNTYWNGETSSQYMNTYMPANHEISVVGWDDNYSRDNFSIKPEGDGAWIAKNSWGSDWGEEGYFYISYYDQSLCDFTVFHIDQPENDLYEYDHNYQYDYLGTASLFRPNPVNIKIGMGNVFVSEQDEILTAVSAITRNPGSEVEIRIYKLSDGQELLDGQLVYEQIETVEYGGYHTIVLDKSVALKKGERFAVTEFVKGRDGYFINIESGFGKDVSELYGLPYKQDVVIEPGQSYLLQEEEGTGELVAEDIYEIPGVNGMKFGNAEIKVFTENQETVPELMLNMDCFDAEGRLIDSSRLLSDHTQIRLSSDTESVSFEKAGQNGEGSYQLSLGGEPYTEGTLISKEDLKGGLEISLVSAPRGNADAKIGYQFVTETVPEKEPSENEDGDKTPGTTDQPEDNTGGDQKDPGKHPSDELSDNKNPGMSEGSGADQTAQDKLKKDTSPRTDDYGNKPALWGCITAAAALGAAVIIRKKKYYS